ncbi:MAG: siderophore-interacting protein [Alphaproteobacteria bacterium]|nr:siderophore-interacting protein [Alphaproteobacteria bacterium]
MFTERVAEQAVRVFGQAVTVTEVEVLSARLRRLRLSGDAVRRMDWSPGHKIKLHVGGGVMRSYTPARVDLEAGWMDVVFYLHGSGPASDWATAAEVGASSVFLGPKRSMAGAGEPMAQALFLGDETTLGLAVALLEALPEGVAVTGAIELAPEDAPALAALGLPLHAAPRAGGYGAALLRWLEAAPLPEGMVWLSGEADSVLTLRDALLARGLRRSQLRIKPYWSTRGSAHRKTLERTALRG